LPELLERPRPWIARFHPVDQCCDAAKRMSDVTTLHAVAGMAGRVTLIRLLDGSAVDQIATYDSREEAERWKTHPARDPAVGVRGDPALPSRNLRQNGQKTS
jgi:hypothetical protein